MRRAALVGLVTAVAVVLLARYETHPPRLLNPNSALRARATPLQDVTPEPSRRHRRPPTRPGLRTAAGHPIATPFSVVQVQVTLDHGKLVGVKTLALTGSDPHTQALNRRAEPILRREALKAGGSDIDTVSGATYTSNSWKASLDIAMDAASR
jgi:uncharacterized protein with FMN-binding domain